LSSFPLISLAATSLLANDPYCSRYPEPQRQPQRDTLARDQAVARLHAQTKGGKRAAIERRNLIDEQIFGKMDAEGVVPVPLATDAEFLRRISLDLTGRIPTWQRVEAFLANPDPNKRTVLIEELLKSEEYVDRWALFYRDLFEITTRYYNYVSRVTITCGGGAALKGIANLSPSLAGGEQSGRNRLPRQCRRH